MTDIEKRYRPLLEAIAFAARAHHGQLRKDGRTPYHSHVFRVCLVAREVFGIEDPATLTAAALHDTLEDTTTDHDDLTETFGPDVADWVAALSKDKRLPEEEREKVYIEQLQAAPWQVKVCKLADIFDNLMDSVNLPPEKQSRTLRNSRRYLDALKKDLPGAARRAWEIVARLHDDMQKPAGRGKRK
ncbi:MAG: HD domain-containing protein [Gemmataceae bacterium]